MLTVRFLCPTLKSVIMQHNIGNSEVEMAWGLTRDIETFMGYVKDRNPHEPEFHQAVFEVASSLLPFLKKNPKYAKAKVLERLIFPDRVYSFAVSWVDDRGEIQINMGYRVQWNNEIGPYKGGLRFHPSVYLGKLKFLAFEQTFKNALTTLEMGGAKGGSDFDPKGKSDNEVMRFCQAFMNELYKWIGENIDVPAGDIGVGAREIGYLFGAWKKLTGKWGGAFTGKGPGWGGSLMRPEATGYGAVYFAEEMLKTRGDTIEGKICLVSGSGNVAQYTVQRLVRLGAKPVTMSDSDGFIYDPEGINEEKLAWVMELKNVRRGRIGEYADEFSGARYFAVAAVNHNPLWNIPAQCAFPSATENEINGIDAKNLTANGVYVGSEGANMPSTIDAVNQFVDARILYGPGKAANAGGVAVSGLEMSQNSMRESWSWAEVNDRLREIMRRIHESCVKYGREEDGFVNYVNGANIAGFVKVADAMI